jgi:hypothetical protein
VLLYTSPIDMTLLSGSVFLVNIPFGHEDACKILSDEFYQLYEENIISKVL